jgi:Tol biopolymer transport system component
VISTHRWPGGHAPSGLRYLAAAFGLACAIAWSGESASEAPSPAAAPAAGADTLASPPAPAKTQPAESLPDSYEVRPQKPLERRFDPQPPLKDLGPDNSYGGYDLWMTHQEKDGSWTVPVNLGPNVNSSVRELSPAVSHDGKLFYFAAKDRPDGFGEEDIYVCERHGDKLGPAKNLGHGVNTTWEEMGPCPMPDGKSLLFSRRDPIQRSHDLAISVLVDGQWLDAIGLGRPLATPGQERFPTVTPDGKTLFFAADWRGGRGRFDLWQSYRDDRGNWSEPINLGPTVNTKDSEYSPSISPDGERLFFSSQRAGNTGWDIYVTARKQGGTWQEGVPLPSPVNTPEYNEYCPSMAPDGRTLYFSSDRPHGKVSAVHVEE